MARTMFLPFDYSMKSQEGDVPHSISFSSQRPFFLPEKFSVAISRIFQRLDSANSAIKEFSDCRVSSGSAHACSEQSQ
jgi:hypothetical protein